jgi:hypothetical protein
MNKAIQINHLTERWGIGLDIYPYQIAFGISLRLWSCMSAPAFRIYFLIFKIWGYYSFQTAKKQEDETEH